jgi:hypothetical protein
MDKEQFKTLQTALLVIAFLLLMIIVLLATIIGKL